MSFKQLGLSPHVIQSLKINQIAEPLPIQSAMIPTILEGHDVLGIAPTGSGKTAAFIAPILEQRQNANYHPGRSIPVLIIVPTRELAIQIHTFIEDCLPYLKRDIKSMAIYGGYSIHPQMKYLHGIEILVATPGRLIDLIQHKSITIQHLSTLIIDEADKIFQHGFEEELHNILKEIPKNCQHILCSATLNNKVQAIKETLNIMPEVLDVQQGDATNPIIHQKAYRVLPAQKGPLLRQLIKELSIAQAIIFVSSTRTADNIQEKLSKHGISSVVMHGKLSQTARIQNLEDFKEGKYPFIITTDLLARGIHIDELPYVINYDLPRSPLDFVHRIGRTGRIHAEGHAITLITPEDDHHFKIIQKKGKFTIPIDDMVPNAS